MAITLDGTDGITAPNVFGHNLIINGDGGVNQRGYTSGTATTGANQYTLDRWRVVTSGESLTFTGNEAGRTMTAPSGGVEQVIEGLNIAGGTYVITWTGTATGAVDGTTVSSGDTVTLTANTNATVKFTSGTFTNVKVEEGSIATPFRKRSYGEELTLCKRYFETSLSASIGSRIPIMGSAYSSNTTSTYFEVEKRAAGTLSVYDYNSTVTSSPTSRVEYNSIGTSSGVFINVSATYTEKTFFFVGVTNTGLNGIALFKWTLDAEL